MPNLRQIRSHRGIVVFLQVPFLFLKKFFHIIAKDLLGGECTVDKMRRREINRYYDVFICDKYEGGLEGARLYLNNLKALAMEMEGCEDMVACAESHMRDLESLHEKDMSERY